MNRRSFLQRLGIATIGLTLARHLPGIAPQAPNLAFHPDAFEMVTDPLLNRVDVLYGWSTVTVPPAPAFQIVEFR